MSIDTKDYIYNLIKNMNLIKPDDIPNIDLYMDQVTTFMEKYLGSQKRTDDDKVLTKTMINNYAKNDLLPPPEKKKYSKDHVLLLTIIYYFKSFLSIGDIKTLTAELNEKYFKSTKKIRLSDIYSQLLSSFPHTMDAFKRDLSEISRTTDTCMENTGSKDAYLEKFFFISLIGLDVYMKKQLIESLIDDMAKKQELAAEKAEKRKDSAKKTPPQKKVTKEKAAKPPQT